MFDISKPISGVMEFIMLAVYVVIISAVFLAVWSPILRPNIVAVLNDANFTATYGTGIATAALFIVDIMPFLVFAALIAAIAVVIANIVKK